MQFSDLNFKWVTEPVGALKIIEEGFDRGIKSKHDMCAHGKFKWEDCESCCVEAIRSSSQAPSHHTDTNTGAKG